MRILNKHPKILMGNEVDAMWLSYCLSTTGSVSYYKNDSPAGLKRALNEVEHLINKTEAPKNIFKNYLKQLHAKGAYTKSNGDFNHFEYIGDQKPYQNADPKIVDFIEQHWNNTRYIHLVRHPFQVIESSKNFNNKTGGYLWSNKTDQQLLDNWILNEKNALNVSEIAGKRYFKIYYNDLVNSPKKSLHSLFNWLNIKTTTSQLNTLCAEVRNNKKPFNNIDVKPQYKTIFTQHGFKTKFGYYERTVAPLVTLIYNKIRGGF